MRGTFGNIRLRNRLADGKEGPYTIHLPDGEEGSSTTSQCATSRGVPSAILAGREPAQADRATGRPRVRHCWAFDSSLAESYERIHRSNLVGMGILPLQFRPGERAASLGLTGRELYDVGGLEFGLTPHQRVTVSAHRDPAAAVTVATAGSRRSPGSTAPSTSSTTAPAGSCQRSCAASRQRPDAPRPGQRRSPRGRNRGLLRGGACLLVVWTRHAERA